MNKSQLATLFKRASYSSIGEFVGRVSAAVAGLIVARAIGSEAFGVYVSLWALITLGVSLTEIGITYGLQREGARHPEFLGQLLGNTLLVKGVIGCFILGIVYFYTLKYYTNPLSLKIFIPLSLSGFSIILSEPLYTTLYVNGRQKIAALFETVRGMIFILGAFVFLIFKFDVFVFCWFQGILYVVTCICAFFVTTSMVVFSVNILHIRKQIYGSFVFGISGMLFSIYSQMPIVILSHFASAKEVGIFAVALRFVVILLMVAAAAANKAFLPTLFGLYSNNLEKFRYVCEFMQKTFFLLGTFITMALYIFADAIILILLGEKYSSSIPILRVLSGAVMLNFSVLAAGAALTSADQMKMKIVFQIITIIVGAVFGVFSVLHFGVLGASFTMLIICLTQLILYVPYAKKLNLLGQDKSLGNTFRFMILLSLITIGLTVLLPSNHLLRPIIFLILCFFVFRNDAVRILRDYQIIVR